MARRRGLSEKSYYAFNPLPPTTDADLLERAGLDLMDPVSPLPFAVSWKYGGTLESEVVRIPPGDMIMLRGEIEVKDFAKAWTEQGMVILENPQDLKEVRAKTIAGLQKAVQFWAQRGAKKLVELRKLHGYSKEDMDDYKHDHWVYHINQAKADILAELLRELRKPATVLANPIERAPADLRVAKGRAATPRPPGLDPEDELKRAKRLVANDKARRTRARKAAKK